MLPYCIHFFLTTVPTPWLDNRHIVVGRVRRMSRSFNLPPCARCSHHLAGEPPVRAAIDARQAKIPELEVPCRQHRLQGVSRGLRAVGV